MLRRHRTALTALVWLSFGACYLEHNGDFCKVDSDCHDPAFSHCDTANNACSSTAVSGGDMGMPMIKCTSSASCPFDQPICGSDGRCALCTTPGSQPPECANKTGHSGDTYCGPNGACVGCVDNGNCAADGKTCAPAGSTNAFSCQPCVHNEDCLSGVCVNTVCQNREQYLYVDGSNASCSNSGMGTFQIPFCSVQAGLVGSATSLPPGQLVVVFGSPTHTYTDALIASNAQATAGGNYTANALGVNNPIVRPTASGAALAVNGSAPNKKVNLTMEGFTFDGSGLSDGTSDLIDCNGGSSNFGDTQLTLRRSTVTAAQALGLYAQSKCTVTLDADIFYLNKTGGIQLVSSDFALSNLLVRENGTAGTVGGSSVGGISVLAAGETGKMTMFNLTVVNNKVKTGSTVASGIGCTAQPTTLANTVVFGNTGGGLEMSFLDCNPTYSAFVDTAGTSTAAAMNENFSPVGGKACTATDIFVDPTNSDPSKVSFVPKTGAAKPCALVDLGTATGAPDHDLVGNKRTNTPDIGAYEAK